MNQEEIIKLSDGCIELGVATKTHPYIILDKILSLSELNSQLKIERKEKCVSYMKSRRNELPWVMG